jgi:glycosyltransferase involved in cell wall biosynthesis
MASLVSVIIPSYNRYEHLLNAIQSVRTQDYGYMNIEIIVVTDGCEYPELPSDINIVKLPENTKLKFGYVASGYVRTMGILHSRGEYIALLDDDDIFLPNKLSLQINAMKQYGVSMSCCESLIGKGKYDPSKEYQKFNLEHAFNYISGVFHSKGKPFHGFPKLFDLEFIETNNSIITSSVVMERKLLDRIGYMEFLPNGREDYNCWLRALKFTKCVYISEPLMYYDDNHGSGRNYVEVKRSR